MDTSARFKSCFICMSVLLFLVIVLQCRRSGSLHPCELIGGGSPRDLDI